MPVFLLTINFYYVRIVNLTIRIMMGVGVSAVCLLKISKYSNVIKNEISSIDYPKV